MLPLAVDGACAGAGGSTGGGRAAGSSVEHRNEGEWGSGGAGKDDAGRNDTGGGAGRVVASLSADEKCSCATLLFPIAPAATAPRPSAEVEVRMLTCYYNLGLAANSVE